MPYNPNCSNQLFIYRRKPPALPEDTYFLLIVEENQPLKSRQINLLAHRIRERVIQRIVINEEVKRRLLEMLDNDIAGDDQFIRAPREGDYRQGVVEHITLPFDMGRRRDFQPGSLDTHVMPFTWTQQEPVLIERHLSWEQIFRQMLNAQSLHRQ
jgi:hypothetical protein